MNGFRIVDVERRVDSTLVDAFRDIAVSHVSDCMSRLSGFGSSIRPMHTGGGVMAGPAVTVRTRPGDNLAAYKALDMAHPGDVLVIDGGGDLSNALMGEIMFSYAVSRRLAGVVVNGAIRDSAWVKANAFPVFCAGICHRGPYRNGPGEVNFPIGINGSVVMPGDLILGDDDGVLVVAKDEAHIVFKAAQEKHAWDNAQMAAISEGNYDNRWIDDMLREHGAQIF